MAGISDVYREAGGASAGMSEDIIKNVFTAITKMVRNGDDVQIKGFGTFKKVRTEERQGVNPQKPTEKITIAAKDHLKFKASPSLDMSVPKPAAGRRR